MGYPSKPFILRIHHAIQFFTGNQIHLQLFACGSCMILIISSYVLIPLCLLLSLHASSPLGPLNIAVRSGIDVYFK